MPMASSTAPPRAVPDGGLVVALNVGNAIDIYTLPP